MLSEEHITMLLDVMQTEYDRVKPPDEAVLKPAQITGLSYMRGAIMTLKIVLEIESLEGEPDEETGEEVGG